MAGCRPARQMKADVHHQAGSLRGLLISRFRPLKRQRLYVLNGRKAWWRYWIAASIAEKCSRNNYLNFDLPRNFQSIIDFDPEIPHRAFILGMTRQYLDCTQVLSLPLFHALRFGVVSMTDSFSVKRRLILGCNAIRRGGGCDWPRLSFLSEMDGGCFRIGNSPTSTWQTSSPSLTNSVSEVAADC